MSFGLAILGPYYSTYEVTRADVELAREFGLIASMHVGGGKPMVPDGFERAAERAPDRRQVHDRARQRHCAGHRPPASWTQGGTFTVTAEIELQMGYGDPLTGVLHALGSPISIGTDVEPAVGSDLFTGMRITLAARAQPRHHRDAGQAGSRPERMPLTCRDALAWVTTGAAKVAGLDHRIGSITPGKQADIVLLRADDLNLIPMHDVVGCVVMQAGPAMSTP